MNKIILITGATDGIGKETALELARMGNQIIIHGRNEQKARNTVAELKKRTNNPQISYLIADLFSLQSVMKLADLFKASFDHLDVLINNAGAVLDDNRSQTENGIEATMQLNVISPLLLSELLMPRLRSSNDGRIINMSSGTAIIAKPRMNDLNMDRINSGQTRYGISKLFVIWNTQHMAKRLKDEGINNVSVNVSHPGSVATNFGQDSNNGFINNLIYKVALKSHLMAAPSSGAATNVYLATSNDVKGFSGKFFNNKCKMIKAPTRYYNIENEEKLWNYCFNKIKPFLNR
ncbi:SDR family NAD(P)-dependent oxidoreductase [Lactobacillus sp. Sy-1]|uniref:SDR family NAD(P)-dependent oxidoreductase n=1 Tax=Lactobacillus sp. Sy-1 TaxID=2109645 RepID=UPI001C5A62A3|nr:SDR family NAD(P)-dependent oxidoreductase [Lactobacillus sp. Sy-1]MBW1606403.1 SDR family NAD(P)-dependent oxidoreductase [Lactobacillus sp. Sy-1]